MPEEKKAHFFAGEPLPTAEPEPDTAGRLHLRSSYNPTLVLFFAAAGTVLFFLVGFLLLPEHGRGSLPLSLGGFASACLFLAGGLRTRAAVKNCRISYDERSITYTSLSRRTFTCRWEEITALRLRNSAAYRLDTPYGRILFDYTWPGHDRLAACAARHAVNAVEKSTRTAS